MEAITLALQALDEYLTLKNYSKSTRKAYWSGLKQFLHWRLKEGFTGELEQSEARSYILFRYESGLKWQTINGDYSAIMHYYKDVLGKPWEVSKLPRPRKERRLPRIISKQKVERIIANAANLKHQTLLCLLYGTGLRIGEALSLKIADIDGERKQLLVAGGKGAKDRYVDIPDCLLQLMRYYYYYYRPHIYLFNGQDRQTPLAIRSAQRLIQETVERAGIVANVSPHTFRHCYATHHLENGTDLVYLQQQMGHKHLKTTAKYIHLMKTQSWRIHHPIADLEIKRHPKMS